MENNTQLNLERICKGHIVHTINRCEKCKIDGYNKRCESYVPVYLRMYKVEEIRR